MLAAHRTHAANVSCTTTMGAASSIDNKHFPNYLCLTVEQEGVNTGRLLQTSLYKHFECQAIHHSLALDTHIHHRNWRCALPCTPTTTRCRNTLLAIFILSYGTCPPYCCTCEARHQSTRNKVVGEEWRQEDYVKQNIRGQWCSVIIQQLIMAKCPF